MDRSFAGYELAPGLIADASRVYLGADVPNDDFTTAESLLGRKLAWHRRHDGAGWDTTTGVWPWASDVRIAEIQADIAAGIVPVVVFAFTAQGSGGVPVKTSAGSGFTNTKTVSGRQGLDRFTGGEWDAKTLASLKRLAALPSPILFIFGQEMNIPAMGGYHGYQGGTAPYVAAFRHFADLKRLANAQNVGIGWCPTLFLPKGDTHSTVFATFPGADVLSFAGFDAYRSESPLAGTCDWAYDFIVGKGLPVVVCEWGDYPASLATDLAAAVAAMKSTRYQAIVGFMPWALPGISDNRFNATTSTLASWKKTVADPFLGVTRATAVGPPPPPPVENGIHLTAFPTNPTADTAPEFDWTPRVKYSYILDGGSPVNLDGATSVKPGPLAKGTHTIVVEDDAVPPHTASYSWVQS